MALNIGQVDAQVHIEPGAAVPAAEPGRPGDGPAAAASGRDLLERIRPMVIEILEQELARYQRQQG